MTTPHHIVRSDALAEPRGYAHAVASTAARLVHCAGQTALTAEGRIDGTTLVEQFDRAAQNVVLALRAAGAEPHHVVSMTVYVTDVAGYRESLGELGRIWRRHFDRHYPAMAVIGVSALFDRDALVELVAVAAVP